MQRADCLAPERLKPRLFYENSAPCNINAGVTGFLVFQTMLSSPSLVYVGRISHYSFPTRKVADRQVETCCYTNSVR